MRPAQADIEKVRDPSVQTERMGVPESHLGGHAFHTYRSVVLRVLLTGGEYPSEETHAWPG
jgi:hypothetical protein